MNDMENKDLTTQQPETPAEPTAEAAPPVEPPAPAPEPQPIPEPQPTPESQPVPEPQPTPESQPVPEPAWEKPTPQLTLDPDPEIPAIKFTSEQTSVQESPFSQEPPHAPEPPAPPQAADPQPTVQNQYVYNFNAPDQGQTQSQGQQYSQPYAGYQPPNYTAGAYRPQPQQQPMYTTPPIGYQQKSRLAAGLLALIFGCLGIHNFYMGFNGRGTVQLLLALLGGVLTCGVGTVAAAIWGFIEGVMLLSSTGPRFDGNSVIMKD